MMTMTLLAMLLTANVALAYVGWRTNRGNPIWFFNLGVSCFIIFVIQTIQRSHP